MFMEAIAKGINLPISTKHTTEVARNIRNKDLAKSMKFLQEVIEMRTAVAFKRFNNDRAHRKGKGMGPGAYPQKASKALLKLLRSAMNNAIQKGMNPENLKVSRVEVGMGVSKHRRSNRRLGRQTNILIEVKEND